MAHRWAGKIASSCGFGVWLAAVLATNLAGGEAQSSYAAVKILGIPHIQQKPDFCGEACAAMYLRKLGYNADQEYVFNRSGLDPMLARGCFTKELAEALQNIGFDVGPIWRTIDAAQARAHIEEAWRDLHADLRAGVPSIVCMHYDNSPRTSEHFRLVVGYRPEQDEVLYHEPAEAAGAYRAMPRSRFFELWPLKYDARKWTLIRLTLAVRHIEPIKPSGRFTNAYYVQHIMKLKPKLPSADFTIVLTPPFVVIGDDTPDEVRRRSRETVAWAVRLLKKSYFRSDPNEILDIWLFKDKTSYMKHAEALFGEKPDTPYGYFSAADKALVMNISTGGGTLVHEIVHPFVAADFPRCPSWFNEGLASLYEQCGEEDGMIWGYTNWRLPALQKAIRNEKLPTFKELCGTTTRQFYDGHGTNYAQARYLCYYLQKRDLLVKFYQQFRDRAAADPTGYQTLQAVLDRTDMDAFQKEWQQFVLKLEYR